MRLTWLVVLLLSSYSLVNAQFDDDNDIEDMDQDDLSVDPESEELVPDTEPSSPPAAAEKIQYNRPTLTKGVHFQEPFDDLTVFNKRWVKSQAKKDGVDSDISKYDGEWSLEEPADSSLIGDMSLVLKSKAHHHAIGAALDKPFEFTDKPFILQYEVKFANGLECGGAYVKLLTKQPTSKLSELHDKTPYTIMFGPDKCGNDNKLHFIFRHKHPITGEYEEKHAKKPSASLDSYFTDRQTHVYRLVINTDNTFEVSVDQSVINQGSLLKDVEPAVNPPKEIEDPDDKKPENWDDRPKIKDPDAVKPDDWDESAPEKIDDIEAVKPEGWLDDEPELIPDPIAAKPEDWDVDMDGEWEAAKITNTKCAEAPGCGEWIRPKIKNPDYKGKWTAEMIENPDYQGIWKAKIIDNPNYFEDLEPHKMSTIFAIGLELWSMTDGIMFDNFIITDDLEIADAWTTQTYVVKSMQEKATESANSQSVVGAIKEATRERPWLWAVIILVVALPIVLIIAYCCSGGSKPDTPASSKKTDEPTPDDEGNNETVDDEGNDSQGSGDGPSRSDLGAGGETAAQETGDTSDVKDDKEAEGEDGEEGNSISDSPGRSLRKREKKTRKE